MVERQTLEWKKQFLRVPEFLDVEIKCLFGQKKKEIAKILRLFFPGHSASIFSTDEKNVK